MIYGYLRDNGCDEFFITQKENETTELNLANVPSVINLTDSATIHYIGENVRLALKRGGKYFTNYLFLSNFIAINFGINKETIILINIKVK